MKAPKKNCSFYLFNDKVSGRDFIVEEENENNATFIAKAYYREPEFKKVISEHEKNSSLLCLLKVY